VGIELAIEKLAPFTKIVKDAAPKIYDYLRPDILRSFGRPSEILPKAVENFPRSDVPPRQGEGGGV
jgi:hypothetical protein